MGIPKRSKSLAALTQLMVCVLLDFPPPPCSQWAGGAGDAILLPPTAWSGDSLISLLDFPGRIRCPHERLISLMIIYEHDWNDVNPVKRVNNVYTLFENLLKHSGH